jgi:hypothetical protein
MVYWGKHYGRFAEVFIHYGAVVDLRPLDGKRIGSHHDPSLRLAFG